MNNPITKTTEDSQTLLNKLVIEFMHEQKRKRRRRWIMCGIIISLIVLVYYKNPFSHDAARLAKELPHVGIVDVEGAIFNTDGSNADGFAKGLAAAYKSTGLKAIIFRINSPGGSPVQADYMYNSIQFYRKQYPSIKTYAVCVDICTSAAYYVAAAADEIYAAPASLVGSIGVLYNGFGFVDTMQKLGVTRRLYTSGLNKNFLDPFSPENSDQKAFLQTLLDDVHQQFIDKVKAGRGDRLHSNELTFSGLFWTGQQAKTIGLIDGFASSGQLARDIIKIDTIIDYTYKQSLFERMNQNIGANSLTPALGQQIPLALFELLNFNAKQLN